MNSPWAATVLLIEKKDGLRMKFLFLAAALNLKVWFLVQKNGKKKEEPEYFINCTKWYINLIHYITCVLNFFKCFYKKQDTQCVWEGRLRKQNEKQVGPRATSSVVQEHAGTCTSYPATNRSYPSCATLRCIYMYTAATSCTPTRVPQVECRQANPQLVQEQQTSP